MSRQVRTYWVIVLSGAILATGCQPVQPFFFMEDGDLSHYVGVATDIEYPDVEICEPNQQLNGVDPLTLESFAAGEFESLDMTLEEVTRIALNNSEVIRQLGSVTIGQIVGQDVETISRTIASPVAVPTIYDPALVETGTGAPTGLAIGGAEGVESALAAFDAQLDSSVFWTKNTQPQNRPDTGVGADLFPPIFAQELGQFTAGINKVTATGTQFGIRNNTNYEGNNVPTGGATPFRALPSDWTTNFEATFSHPFLQGRGTEYNRIAGPFSFQQYAANQSNPIDGVVIARINTDVALADLESGVRNLLCDIEEGYWELYFAYRDLESRNIGLDSAQETWKNIHAKFQTGARGGGADQEAQARSQYFLFKSQVEEAATRLLQSEANLRYLMGWPQADGRLIRPADEPTIAWVNFDWAEIHSEALVRRVEVRKQKWEIKRRELQLIAAKNHLLPRLDAVGTYRWRGLGDDLIAPERTGVAFNEPGSTAFDVLTSGDFQEWQLGLQLSVPIGYRRQHATVRQHQLLLARDRALLQALEGEVSHELANAIRSMKHYYMTSQTLLNRRVATEQQVQILKSVYENGRIELNVLLDAQRFRAEAESAYYQALVNYNALIMRVHCRKGSALDYHGVYLAEGPWPGRAYFNALRHARQRDASMYMDYGFTMPGVISKGPYQNPHNGCYDGTSGYESVDGELIEGEILPAQPTLVPADNGNGEVMPIMDDQAGIPQTGEFADNLFTGEVIMPASHSGAMETPGAVQPASLWQDGENRSLHPLTLTPQSNQSSLRPLPAVYELQADNPASQAAPGTSGWSGAQSGQFGAGVPGQPTDSVSGPGGP